MVTAGETVDLDTASIRRTDSVVSTWLRWDLDRSGPALAWGYRLERVELDCRTERMRVLEALVPGGRAGPLVILPLDSTDSRSRTYASGSPMSLVLDSADMAWRTYSRGSLGAQAVREACRRLTRA
jgi:hypothetical protein